MEAIGMPSTKRPDSTLVRPLTHRTASLVVDLIRAAARRFGHHRTASGQSSVYYSESDARWHGGAEVGDPNPRHLRATDETPLRRVLREAEQWWREDLQPLVDPAMTSQWRTRIDQATTGLSPIQREVAQLR